MSDPSIFQQLRELLDRTFNEEELRTLCFDLALDYDNLPGGTKGNKLRELVSHFERTGRLPDLLAWLTTQRPTVAWPSVAPRAAAAPGTLIVLNFSHPLLPEQLAKIEELTRQRIREVRGELMQLTHVGEFEEQVCQAVDRVGLTPEAWQGSPIVVNPPGYAPAAVVLLAELHGRMGHFPTVLRLRPLPGSSPTQYEVAEVMNLQTLRDAARKRRR